MPIFVLTESNTTINEMVTRIISTFTMMLAIVSGSPLYRVELNTNATGQIKLFEGDLKIPDALIQHYYNMSSIGFPIQNNSSREVRAVASNVRLWENGIIPYIISSSFSSDRQEVIRDAMDIWEDNTCLRFVPRGWKHLHYLRFQNRHKGCYYTSIGREGFQHKINLEKNRCTNLGKNLHEIGHAIGFWHEQSRPDRDSYVTINWNNIRNGKSHNFMRRKDFDIDYQGSGYDYGSIMRYRDTAFVKHPCRGCKTIEVNNNAAYIAQARPSLGQRDFLSNSDIQQANRLYSCPGTGVHGCLTVRVKFGRGLNKTDGIWNLPDPYVKITAVDGSGRKHTDQTSTKSGTLKPICYENLEFPKREWQFFRIRVWDDDWIFDDQMSMSETVVIRSAWSGSHSNLKHCHDTLCKGYVYYDYSIFSC